MQDPLSTFFGSTFTGVQNGRNVVALTFDDGPNGADTVAVLDTLREEGIPATFFVVGEAAQREPVLLQRMVREGHALGNHGWSHARWNFLRRESLRRELERTDDAIFEATRMRTRIARPPFGARSFHVLDELRVLGYTCVLWSAPLAMEWEQTTPEVIAGTILEGTTDGSIIVLHDGDRGRPGNRHAVPVALRRIVHALRERGLRFTTVEEMLALAPSR